MKKIGLMTFHASHNIGSMLQTYAMQYVLTNRYGFDVKIIDFSNKEQQEMYALYNKKRDIKNILKNGIIFLGKSAFQSRFDDFENFLKNYLKTTHQEYETTDELIGIDKDFDILVCGSDQIWNINCLDFDDAYYLAFATDIPKIAYAPSLGGRNILTSTSELEKYRGYLNDFSSLSVREENGKRWLEELSNRDVELVPDPTMLLDKEVWDQLAVAREFDEDYIFFYGAVYDQRTYNVLNLISKKLGMRIVMLDIKSWIFKGNFMKGIKLSKHTSPRDYLSLIKNAKLVITTSYHGTIFSTIYRKNFWLLTFKETNPDDDRVQTLLKQLNFEDRRIFLEEIENYDLSKNIDYSSYDYDVEQLRSNGFRYLTEALEQ